MSSTIEQGLASARWQPPAAVRVRGTVVVLAGRGESAAVYERFGRRISADGYDVHVLAGTDAERQSDAVAWLAVDAVRPIVAVGSDTGALDALVLAGEAPDTFAGMVLAGIPLARGATPSAWDDEVASRSACPVHRVRMDADIARGALDAPVDELRVRRARSVRPAGHVLILHGEADPVAPLAAVRDYAANLPGSRLVTVVDGRHDVLNDLTHRSVAAEVVQFLERLRSSDDATPLLRVATP